MKTGPTFEDVCRMAIDRGVTIVIRQEPKDVREAPQRITVRVEPTDKSAPSQGFAMDLLATNPDVNRLLGHGLGEYVDKVKPRRTRIISLVK